MRLYTSTSCNMKNYCRLILLAFIFSSCGVYRQNVINTPMLQKKGQLQAGVYEGFSGNEAQASYSVTDKVGILANYNSPRSKKVVYAGLNYSETNHYFGEAGIGLFRPKKDSGNKIRELFLLVGNGMTSYYVQSDADSTGYIDKNFKQTRYNRFCLQGDLGKVSKHWGYAISPRLFLINYYGTTDNKRPDMQNTSNTYMYMECALTGRYTFARYIIISSQISLTLPTDNISYYDFAPWNLSVGLAVNLNLLKKQKL